MVRLLTLSTAAPFVPEKENQNKAQKYLKNADIIFQTTTTNVPKSIITVRFIILYQVLSVNFAVNNIKGT